MVKEATFVPEVSFLALGAKYDGILSHSDLSPKFAHPNIQEYPNPELASVAWNLGSCMPFTNQVVIRDREKFFLAEVDN